MGSNNTSATLQDIVLLLQIFAYIKKLLALLLPNIAIAHVLPLNSLDLKAHCFKLIKCMDFHISLLLKFLFDLKDSSLIENLFLLDPFVDNHIFGLQLLKLFLTGLELVDNFLQVNIFEDLYISNFGLHGLNLLGFCRFELKETKLFILEGFKLVLKFADNFFISRKVLLSKVELLTDDIFTFLRLT